MEDPTTLKVLRWLADELEAGRAKVELSVELDSEWRIGPRSWKDPDAETQRELVKCGGIVRIKATTTRQP